MGAAWLRDLEQLKEVEEESERLSLQSSVVDNDLAKSQNQTSINSFIEEE